MLSIIARFMSVFFFFFFLGGGGVFFICLIPGEMGSRCVGGSVSKWPSPGSIMAIFD